MKIVVAFATFVIVQVVVYLFGAVAANSFDLSQWSFDGRFFTVLIGFCSGPVLATLAYKECK